MSIEIVQKTSLEPFVTLDGSQIRELMAWRNSSIRNQSLAEATVPVGGSTAMHYHARTEEIYYILKGRGKIKIEQEEADVFPGEAIAIPPGRKHKIWNIGDVPLVFLCMCAPCYEHTDTYLTE